MPSVQFVTQSAVDSDNRAANTSRLINCYIEPVGGRSPMVLKSVLGMTEFATVPGVFARAVKLVGDLVYIVQYGKLYSVSSAAVVTELGDVVDSESTTISSSDDNVTVAAGGRYYVWDGATLTEPASGAFSSFGSVAFFNGLTVLTERNGNRVQWSDIYDPTTLDGLSFATADAHDGKLLRVLSIGGSVYMFKANSIEQWYQNGADLAPVAGGAIEYGLKGYNLIAPFPNGAFFVSSDNKVMRMGGGIQAISNRAVETAIAQGEPTHCLFYQDEGHDFCVIRFGSRPAWVYDIATGLWHERSEGEPGDTWTASHSFNAWGGWHVVTQTGKIYTLGRTNADYGEPLIRQATSSTLQNDDELFCIDKVRMLARAGRADIGRDAQLMLETSKDFGETWTDPKVASVGALGEYGQRTIWRRLGQFRQFTARVTWADVAEIPVDNIAMVDIS